MKLTKQQLRAAARHARQLASEVCEGTAPNLVSHSWCGCALDHVARRMRRGKRHVDADTYRAWDLAEFVRLPNGIPHTDEGDLVSFGLRFHGHDGAVFPLLALADELENAASGRPQDLP